MATSRSCFQGCAPTRQASWALLARCAGLDPEKSWVLFSRGKGRRAAERSRGLQRESQVCSVNQEPWQLIPMPVPVVCFCGTPLAATDDMCRMCHTARSELTIGRPPVAARAGGDLPTLLSSRAVDGRPTPALKCATTSLKAELDEEAGEQRRLPARLPEAGGDRHRPPALARLESGSLASTPRVGAEAPVIPQGPPQGVAPPALVVRPAAVPLTPVVGVLPSARAFPRPGTAPLTAVMPVLPGVCALPTSLGAARQRMSPPLPPPEACGGDERPAASSGRQLLEISQLAGRIALSASRRTGRRALEQLRQLGGGGGAEPGAAR